MEGSRKRGESGAGRQTLTSMWGLAPRSVAPLSDVSVSDVSVSVSGTRALHPFFAARSDDAAATDAPQLAHKHHFLAGNCREWSACEAAWPTAHVNWDGHCQHRHRDASTLSRFERVAPPANVVFDKNGHVLLPVDEEAAATQRIEASLATLAVIERLQEQAEPRSDRWLSLEDGATECFNRANAVLAQTDTLEVAVARAGLMAQEGRLEQEEWVYESEEMQVEQWLREWGDEQAHDDDGDDDFCDRTLGALAVEGPVGSGKSGILSRAATRTSWKILEVNGGDARSGKLLQAMVSEATRSARARTGRTMLVIEDCGVDLGDAGFSSAVESILAGTRVPVAVVVEDGRTPERWAVSRVVKTSRPRGKPRALLWLLLATLVAQKRVLEAEEALLLLQQLDWDLRAALHHVELQRAGPLWAFATHLPSASLPLYGSTPHGVFAASGTNDNLPVREYVRKSLLRKTDTAVAFQYWPLCVGASLEAAEYVSLGATLSDDGRLFMLERVAKMCEGPLEEEVLALDPATEAAAPMPRALLSLVSMHARNLDVLAFAGLLGRYEGAGRRQTSYLSRVCPLLSASDRAKLVYLATFTKE